MRNYKNDNPIKNPEEDILNRSDKAKALAEYIVSTFQEKSSKSHNIAIRGSWGEGKTSFINLTKGQLEEPKAKNWFYEYLNKIRNRVESPLTETPSHTTVQAISHTAVSGLY